MDRLRFLDLTGLVAALDRSLRISGSRREEQPLDQYEDLVSDEEIELGGEVGALERASLRFELDDRDSF